MKRRHRRRLFNVFAFSSLAIAIYLNMFCMSEERSAFTLLPSNTLHEPGQTVKTKNLSKLIPAKNTSPIKPS